VYCVGYYTVYSKVNGQQNIYKKIAVSLFLSDRIGELDSYKTDFRVNWYWKFLMNDVDTVKYGLKLYKNNRYFAWRPTCTYEHIGYEIHLGYLGHHGNHCSYGCYSYVLTVLLGRYS
jgi:hypothetical protein